MTMVIVILIAGSMILLLAICLLSPTALGYRGPDYYDYGRGPGYYDYGGYDDPVCNNPEKMPRHREYQRVFAMIGEYEKESVDELVIKLMCETTDLEECNGYRRHYGPGRQDTPVEVDTNKTFLQRFEPIMKNYEGFIEYETARYNEHNHREKECPYWTKLEGTMAFHDHRGNYRFKVSSLFSNIFYGNWMIGRHFKSVLKSLNTNTEGDKRLISIAVDTVFGSSDVDPFEFLELHLRTQSKETKALLKMVLSKYISEYLTADRVTCYLQELTETKLLDDHLFSAGKDVFNFQNIAVKKIIENTRAVLEKQGTFPYIDLAHAVVDQLDDVNIPDIMNNQYRNFVKMQKWSGSVDWDKEFERVVNTAKPSYDKVMEALVCDKNGNLQISGIIKKIIKNIYTESLDESLDQSIKILLNFLPSFLRKMQEESGIGLNEFNSTLWLRPFHLTNLLNRNKGALSTILNYDLDVKADGYNDLEYAIGSAVGGIHFVLRDLFFYTSADPVSLKPIVPKILDHLFKGITLTPEEENMVSKPLKTFGTLMSCHYCEIMQKAFKSLAYGCPYDYDPLCA